jgi:hypothetical protein
MDTILLLPLDDRPCNRLFPEQLGRIAGVNILQPPRELLGSFMKAGQAEALAAWMQENAGDAKAAIISIDMLCYGGLIASRTPAVALSLARRRLKSLANLKQALPHLPIYVFNCIMRLSITVDSPQRVSLWQDIALYSQLYDRVKRLGQDSFKHDLAAVRKRIPAEILAAYLKTRKRNHAINREVIRLVSKGVIARAILCQEDCAPYGLHIPEQTALTAQAKELAVAPRIHLHAGTDEAALTLLARAACDLAGWHPKVAVYFGSKEGAQRTALYEDRPIEENAKAHVAACGGKITKESGHAELVLLVHTPSGPQREISQRQERDEKQDAKSAKEIVGRAAKLIKQGRRVAIADVAYCNGGDPALIKALGEAGILPRLAGYAGWNTAGNTLGTALAQGVLWGLLAKKQRKSLTKDRHGQDAHATAGRRKNMLDIHSILAISEQVGFLFSRLVDDYLYQSVVRQEAAKFAEGLGASPFSLGEAKGPVEAFVVRRLRRLGKALFAGSFQGRRLAEGFEISNLKFEKVRLPWPRLFEVETIVKAKVKRQPATAGKKQKPEGGIWNSLIFILAILPK